MSSCTSQPATMTTATACITPVARLQSAAPPLVVRHRTTTKTSKVAVSDRQQPSVSRQHCFHLQFSTCRPLQFPSFLTCQLSILRLSARHLHRTTPCLRSCLCPLSSTPCRSYFQFLTCR